MNQTAVTTELVEKLEEIYPKALKQVEKSEALAAPDNSSSTTLKDGYILRSNGSADNAEYYTVDTELINREMTTIDLLLKPDNSKNIRTAKKWVVFFGVLTVVSMILSFILPFL